MPPRTTRKSTRPRASDRTMVDTVQPPRLPSFRTDRRRRYQKMKLRRGSNTRPQLRRTGQQNHVLLIADRGWMPRKSPLPPVEGKVFSLTSPFIEQGLSLTENFGGRRAGLGPPSSRYGPPARLTASASKHRRTPTQFATSTSRRQSDISSTFPATAATCRSAPADTPVHR